MTSATHPATTADEVALLAAWQAWVREGFLQAGHLKSIGNDRALMAENHYAAFLAGWAAARQRILRKSHRSNEHPESSNSFRCVAEADLLDGES